MIAIKQRGFFGHRGRPGQRGGSLPRKAGWGPGPGGISRVRGRAVRIAELLLEGWPKYKILRQILEEFPQQRAIGPHEPDIIRDKMLQAYRRLQRAVRETVRFNEQEKSEIYQEIQRYKDIIRRRRPPQTGGELISEVSPPERMEIEAELIRRRRPRATPGAVPQEQEPLSQRQEEARAEVAHAGWRRLWARIEKLKGKMRVGDKIVAQVGPSLSPDDPFYQEALKGTPFELEKRAGGGVNDTYWGSIGGIRAIVKQIDEGYREFKGGKDQVNAEVAAYELSRLAGWRIVPPTVHVRANVVAQQFIPGYLDAMEISFDGPEAYAARGDPTDLYRIAALDTLIYNSDRHGRNWGWDDKHHFWAIDNGLGFGNRKSTSPATTDWYDGWGRSFSLWFAGKRIPDPVYAELRQLDAALENPEARMYFEGLIGGDQLKWLQARLKKMVDTGHYLPGKP